MARLVHRRFPGFPTLLLLLGAPLHATAPHRHRIAAASLRLGPLRLTVSVVAKGHAAEADAADAQPALPQKRVLHRHLGKERGIGEVEGGRRMKRRRRVKRKERKERESES